MSCSEARAVGRKRIALVAICALTFSCNRIARNPVARLAHAKVTYRGVEARLSGGFAWAPLRLHTRGSAADIEPGLVDAAVNLDESHDDSTTVRHAVALANVLSGEPTKGAATLETLAVTTSDAAIWSDLAAARYAAAMISHRSEDLVPALVAIDTALRIKNDLPEARFNRALILERLGLRDPAASAWRSFVEIDGGSEWSREARTHLQALTVIDPQFPNLSDKELARLEARPDEVRSLTLTFPQEARLAAERDLLARWGDATKRNDREVADRVLAVVSAIGDQLYRNSGDRMVVRCVAAIRIAEGAKRFALAEGHLDFSAALKAFRSGRSGEAEPVFRRAARELQEGGSPFAFTAHFFAAYARYEEGAVAESTREIEALLPTISSDLMTCRATVQWQLAICLGAEGRWGGDIDAGQASLAAFERAGERANAALMREHVAQAYDLIGEPLTAWSYRAAALPVLGQTSTRFLQAGVLSFQSQEAIFRQEWPQAASFTELELEVGKIARYEPGLADAHLRRALIRHHLGGVNGPDDIARAKSIIASIPDAGMQARLEARRVAVEAMVARTPAEALPLLTSAIEFHSGPRGQRMFLPTLFLYRARSERVLQQTMSARRDIDAALTELDTGRDALKSPDQRLGIFESTDGVVDEAIDLAIEQRDPAGAFAYAEHARARALLDVLQAPAPNGLKRSIPAGAVIVEYAVLPSRVVIFVANEKEILVATRQIERNALGSRISAFIDSLARGSDARTLGQSLYRDLVEPVETWITGHETVVIVPDATTAAIPFAALRTPDGRFLVEKYAFVSSPSLAVFARANAQRSRSSRSPALLMVVNDERTSRGLDALPGVAEEGRRVAKLYGEVRPLSGRAATRAAFIREASGADVIHFAGHALSSEYRSEETSIVLSGPAGRMDIRDIAALKLRRCSTVVLAACSTARGKVRRYEGTLSVARAFLAAGAPSVVATLWPIEDDEAVLFFPRVHEKLARGLSAGEALRAAQLEAIRDSRPPALWAAVQVIGS